jgi:hypothetical protein
MSDLQVRSINEEITIKRPGFFKRLIWLFISPGRLMDELAEKPRVLFWMLFWPIAFVLPLVLRWPLYLDMLREQMAASSDYMESLMGIEMTPEMIEQSVSQSSVSGLITTGILMFVSAVLMALIFFAIFKIMGGKGKFKAYLSVVVHSNIIIALYSLLLIPISYLTNDLHQSIPLTSLATLVSAEDASPALLGLLVKLDIFVIWRYAVMGIGFAAVSKLKKNTVYIVTGAVFLTGLIYGVISMVTAAQILN